MSSSRGSIDEICLPVFEVDASVRAFHRLRVFELDSPDDA